MLNWKYFPDVKISFKSTFKFGLIVSLMLPVEAYRVSKNSTAGLQSYQMLVGYMVCARLGHSREPGLNKAYWASGTKCMAYYCPHSTPCSSHLRGSRLIHLFKQQKLCYWANILAETIIIPGNVSHYCVLSGCFSAGWSSSAVQRSKLSGWGQQGKTREAWGDTQTHAQHHHCSKAQAMPALLAFNQLKSTCRKGRLSLVISYFFSSLMPLIDFLSLWPRTWISKFCLSPKVQDISKDSRQCN